MLPPRLLVPSDEILRQQESLPLGERSALLQRIFLTPRARFMASGANASRSTRMRAYGYVRNAHGSAGENTPMEQQCACISSLAASRNLDLRGCYGDRDTSGMAPIDMPGLLRLLDRCRAGEVDAIIVKDADRLGRSGGPMLVVGLLAEQDIVVFDASLGKPLTLLSTLNVLLNSPAEAMDPTRGAVADAAKSERATR
jgi:hypothetical protein